jgi:hypothetical protein
LIVKLGMVASLLSILWTPALLYYFWRVVRQLSETRFASTAFAILWYTLFPLYQLTSAGPTACWDSICNAYLWLLVAILLWLPDTLAEMVGPSMVTLTQATEGGDFH